MAEVGAGNVSAVRCSAKAVPLRTPGPESGFELTRSGQVPPPFGLRFLKYRRRMGVALTGVEGPRAGLREQRIVNSGQR